MALLAVAALGATVFVAHRALYDASDVVVRGEGEMLVGALVRELAEEESPTREGLEHALKEHEADGLKYVAVVLRGRDHAVTLLEAGHAELGDVQLRPGQSVVSGRRVRAFGGLTSPRRGLRVPGIGHGRFERLPMGPPLPLIVEFEPPVIQTLRRDLTRISVVGAVAGTVLLAFAVAWARGTRRLAAFERHRAQEQRLVALGSMSSVMAHEIRNPLASLKGHAQLLVEDLEEPSDAKRRAKAERVVAEAERLELLTSTLLDFVRDAPLDRAPAAPREVIERSLVDLPGARVELELASAPAAMFVDRERFARALHNVVDNAAQAAPGEPIALTVASEGKRVRVEVRDRGPGLPVGAETKIFEPFVTTRVRGTGLGLAVARRIAEQHGGTLTAHNHRSGGAVFTFYLPAESTEVRGA